MGQQPWYQLDWIWTTTAWLLAIAGFALLLYALFHDRARGRKRCPKCWYDMSGGHLTCPECGRKIRNSTDLLRTRRKWRLACLAIVVLCIGIQISMIGTPGRRGWHGFVPTAALLFTVEDIRFQDASSVALLDRLQHGRVMPWDRMVAAWLELRRAKIDWNATVAHRPNWPVDIPLRAELRTQRDMTSWFQYRTITLEWLDGTANPASASLSPTHVHSFVTSSPHHWITLPPPRFGDNRYRFRVSVASFGVSRSAEVSIAVRGVKTIDEAISPNNAPQSVDEVRNQLAWRLSSHAGKATVFITKGQQWTPVQRDTAYSMKARLYNGAQLIGESVSPDLWWQSLSIPISPDRDDSDAPAWIDISDLSVQIGPAPEAALELLAYDLYWNGAIKVPLRELPWQFRDSPTILLDARGITMMPVDSAAQHHLAAISPLFAKPK